MTYLRRMWAEGAARRAFLVVLWRTHRGAVVAITVLGVLAAAVPSGFVLASGRVVDAAFKHQSLVGPILVAGFLFLGQQLLTPAAAGLADSVGLRLNAELRARAMDAVSAPPGLDHLEDPATQDIVQQVRGLGPGQFTPGAAVPGTTRVFVRRLTIGFALVLIARFSIPLALAVGVAIGTLLRRLRHDLIADVTTMKDRSQALRRADYDLDLVVTPTATKEVRVFGLRGWILGRFDVDWHGAMASVWRGRQRRWSVAIAVIGLVVTVITAAYVVVARAGAHGHLTAGQLTVLLGAIGQAGGFSLGDDDFQLEWGAAAVPALLALERLTNTLVADGIRETAALEPAAPASSVRFEDVHFRYPGRDSDVLRGINLELRAGESLAIVGLNGAGKTTLVKMLAALRVPTSGRIVVDGHNLAHLDRRQWQRRVAAIFQDFTHFELTAADNVAFGGIERVGDMAMLDRAAERAGAATVVTQLPNGWETVLSRRVAGGTDLSGGEWQRIALARALFAVEAGARVLVLDEPTANLDVRAEAELFDRYLELTRGVTTVLVSHRFSTVRRADRICVLEHGVVAELGTHDELLAAGGRYARLFNLQAARFTEQDHADG